MKKKSISILGFVLYFSVEASAQQRFIEIQCKHFFQGYPIGTPASNVLIIRDIYALSNNESTKFADWVAYRLDLSELSGDLALEREWRTDNWLKEESTLEATPNSKDDYKDAGSKLKMDRGHLAPLAHFKGTKYASQANFLSNIVPQKRDLNQGAWRILEEKERELCREYKCVYVMTGTLYEKEMPALPNADEPHQIPSGFWKIIIVPLDKNEKEFQVLGFIFDQETDRNSPILQHIVSINEIERRSKLNFFWLLDKTIEQSLEKKPNKEWAEKILGQ